MSCVLKMLQAFSDISGQMFSMQKTSIYLSNNVDASTHKKPVHMLGFKDACNLGKYLGVPLIGRPRNNKTLIIF